MANYLPAQGINTYLDPLTPEADGMMIHAVNVQTFPFGAKAKRLGYSAFLGTPDNSQVQSLFSFSNIGNDGTMFNLYRASGSAVYSSQQGTGAWTLTGNGTISNGAHVGNAVLSNTMIIGDGQGSTRHTTNGTSFTNTTLAPVSERFTEYHRRIHAQGTSQTNFYSTTNDATNWLTSGTSDSSSFEVPGEGKMIGSFKSEDKLILPKTQGQIFRYDDFSIVDTATSNGPTSPYAIDETEGFYFYPNSLGIFGYSGGKPQLLSNAIQRQFYNDNGTGLQGSVLQTAPGKCHRYDYLLSVGSVTDDFTKRTINNNVIKYDFQKNEFLNWDFANRPTSFHSYKDTSSNQQLIFGDATGQVYKMDTTFSDNGTPIASEMVFVFHYGSPFDQKKWNWWRGIFNPGCEVNIQVACSNSYTYEGLRFEDVGQGTDGLVEYRFPGGSKSRFLFVRLYENSTNSRYIFYGQQIDAVVDPIR